MSDFQDLAGQLQKLAGPDAVPTAASPEQPSPPAAPPSALPGAAADEAALRLNLEADRELLREFLTESREHLDNIEQGALALEHEPEDAETLNAVFRAFHTFKGSAGFLNLVPIHRLAHVLESLLDLARQHRLAIKPPIIELILRGRDTLRQFVDEMEGQLNGSRPATAIDIPITGLKADVLAVAERVANGDAPIEIAQEAQSPPNTEAAGDATPRLANAGATTAEPGGMLRVNTGKLDALLDLVGEMVIAQSLVVPNLNRLADANPHLARNVAQLGRLTKELQRVSLSMRMVPIRGLFQKMARVVRDLAAKQQKSVQLVTSGEDTELDRGVVEELSDPLLHMIRNSIDHGVEPLVSRMTRGKAEVATIRLSASHQGGNIVLEVGDDGAGLNRDRILAKALEHGLTAAGAKHTDEELFNFIFAPGFSTSDRLTDLSGRGVGLDVVRRNLDRLRGCVDISSTPGVGTVFRITLPLTLAIIDGLVVQVGKERFIIPTLSVRESFRPTAEMISHVQGVGEMVNVRGRLLPLLRLYEWLGLRPASTDTAQGIVLVAQAGASSRCLLVDSLLHKQEVVIKNLNEVMIHKNRALAGAAILGDGKVALILDVNALVHLEGQAFANAA